MNMDIDTVKEVIKLLQEYGGWALSVILMSAIVYLHRSMSTLLEKRNDELRQLLAEHKSVLGENRVVLDRNEAMTVKVKEVLEDNTQVLERVKLLMEDFRR
jgi:uncharacterized protein YqgV (UPF0045/DUF77 family)